MDNEKLDRLRSIRLLVSEVIMVLAVIITVIVLALIVSGYWVNSNFEFERQGMLQVYSIPTGADILIDGETSWLQRTNTSKILPSGEHEVTLSRAGYDTWSKKIKIKEGLLYRLHYPRLFLKDRVLEKVLDFSEMTYATVSPDRGSMVVINNTSEWTVVDLSDRNTVTKKINIADYFSGVNLADETEVGLFTSEILSTNWSRDNNHILFKVRVGESIEWVVLDINNLTASINLTKQFGTNFDSVRILNDAASNLLVMQNNNLHRLDIGSKQISAILVENVESFDYYGNEVFFVAKEVNDEEVASYYTGITKINDSKVTRLNEMELPAKIAVSRFYEHKYLVLLQQNIISLYTKEDFVLEAEYEIGFSPNTIKIGHDGEFIVMTDGQKIATLDMEAEAVIEWNIEGERFGWLDDNMIYTVKDGELIAYDYDGLNRRVLSKNVSAHFPVTITDEKWLYYFSDQQLVREWLIPS